jgi:hypothetical protein
MTSERNEAAVEDGDAAEERPDTPAGEGPLLDPEVADRLEQEDRKRPIPGGEPVCPLCGTRVVRHVEKHPAPRGGPSPFRVRLVCPSEGCGGWTAYDW